MADVKISALNALGAAPAAADLIPVVDVSGSETKKLRIDELFTNPNVTGTVTADGLTVDGTGTEAATSQLLKVRNSTTGEAVTIGLYAKADNGGDGNTASITFDAGATGLASDSSLRFSADHQTNLNPALKIDGNRDISFYEDTGTTAKFFWDASAEYLGIGTATPTNTLNVLAPDNNGIQIESAAGEKGYLFFGDNGSNTAGRVGYDHATDHLDFWTDGTERMRIDSSGNLLVGKTSADPTSEGLEVRSDGLTIVTRASNYAGIFNRNTNDGDIVHFRKDNTTVGSIGAQGGNLYIVNGDTGLLFNDLTSEIRPAGVGGIPNDAVVTLGSTSKRFKDLYLSGGVYLGGTGAANLLDDYEEGTWTVTLTDASNNASPTTVTGYYTKVGNKVTASFYTMLNIDTTGMTATDNLFISLPFTSGSTGAGIGAVNHHGIDLGSATQVNFRVANGSAKALLATSGSAIGDGTVLVQDITSADDINFATITYFTA